jgi:hypothetical protein
VVSFESRCGYKTFFCDGPEDCVLENIFQIKIPTKPTTFSLKMTIQIRARHEQYMEFPIDCHTIGELANSLPRKFPRHFRHGQHAIVLEDGVVPKDGVVLPLPTTTRVKPWGRYTFLRCFTHRKVEHLEKEAVVKTDDHPGEFQFVIGRGVPQQRQFMDHKKRIADWEERQDKRQKVIVLNQPAEDYVVPTDPDQLVKIVEELMLLPPSDREGMFV